MIPAERRREENDRAHLTVGTLELWLFLGKVDGKASWEKVVVQRNGFVVDTKHKAPYCVPASVG